MLTGIVIVKVDIETKIVPILDSIHIVFYLNEVDVVPKLMLTISHYLHTFIEKCISNMKRCGENIPKCSVVSECTQNFIAQNMKHRRGNDVHVQTHNSNN